MEVEEAKDVIGGVPSEETSLREEWESLLVQDKNIEIDEKNQLPIEESAVKHFSMKMTKYCLKNACGGRVSIDVVLKIRNIETNTFCTLFLAEFLSSSIRGRLGRRRGESDRTKCLQT